MQITNHLLNHYARVLFLPYINAMMDMRVALEMELLDCGMLILNPSPNSI